MNHEDIFIILYDGIDLIYDIILYLTFLVKIRSIVLRKKKIITYSEK